MEKIETMKCMTLEEVVKVIINLSDIDTSLDIINKSKRKEKIELKWVGNKLRLKN